MFGKLLKHELVFAIPYIPEFNSLYNQQLEQKRKAIKENEKKKQYGSIIAYYERPYRWTALLKYHTKMTDQDYWETLGWIYIDTENLWQYFDAAMELLTADRSNRHFIMDDKEREALAKMPEEIQIYRGWRENELGMSWTLSKETAKWFALRLKRKEEKAYVSTAKIKRERILAHFTGRNEAEIVVNPDDIYSISSKEVRGKLKRRNPA